MRTNNTRRQLSPWGIDKWYRARGASIAILVVDVKKEDVLIFKFWFERLRWLRLYQFETLSMVYGYPTINWWRHTTNILLDIAIHTKMWLCWVWVWGYARSMGGKISFNWWLAFLCHLARERGFYICLTINRDRKTQQYTTYWILQFMWECGRRIYICPSEKILQYSYVTVAKYTMFEVIVKWPGKMGAQTTTKTGMLTKRNYYN